MARSFNGTSDYASASSPISFAGAGPFIITLSAWFNQPSGTGQLDLFNFGTGTNDTTHAQFRLETMSNKVQADLRQGNTGTDDTSASTTTFSFGTWNHAAAIFIIDANPNLTDVIAYLNGGGKNDASFAINLAAFSTTGASIGALVLSGLGQFNFFNGSIADAALWNVQLTDAEILALAKGARPWQIRTQSLKAWFPLDGLASPEPDLSGNAKNATLNGTATASGPPLMMFTPRWPLNSPFGVFAAPTFKAAWATGQRFVNQGIGI